MGQQIGCHHDPVTGSRRARAAGARALAGDGLTGTRCRTAGRQTGNRSADVGLSLEVSLRARVAGMCRREFSFSDPLELRASLAHRHRDVDDIHTLGSCLVFMPLRSGFRVESNISQQFASAAPTRCASSRWTRTRDHPLEVAATGRERFRARFARFPGVFALARVAWLGSTRVGPRAVGAAGGRGTERSKPSHARSA